MYEHRRSHLLKGKNSSPRKKSSYWSMGYWVLSGFFFCHSLNFQKKDKAFHARKMIFLKVNPGTRCQYSPELFQFSGQMSLRKAEAVLVLPRYSKEQQAVLVQNVFLTGGNTMYPGLKARIQKELLEMRPFQSSFQVCGLPWCLCEQPVLLCSDVTGSGAEQGYLEHRHGEGFKARLQTAFCPEKVQVKQRFNCSLWRQHSG